jgi:TorA maturation chaperone TorD
MTGEAVPGAAGPGPGEQARSAVYRLLGTLLARPPDAALLEMLRGITPDEAGDGAVLTAAWEALRAAAGRATPAGVEEEYFNLFIGLGRGEVVPYASFYLHGLLMERTLAVLRDDLAALGISRRPGVVEPEDHAGAVCETMGMLITDHGLDLQQSGFFERYIGSWMDRFFQDLGKADAAEFYRAVAVLGQALLAVERRYLSLPD